MPNIFDVNQDQLIKNIAEELKTTYKIDPPAWSKFVKTGVSKQRVPENLNWWYIRSASLLRKVFVLGPIGVQKLRRKYGGRKNCGTKPEKSYRGSGKIIRTILQQLESVGLVEKNDVGRHKGKAVTSKGMSILSKAAKKSK